MKSLTPFIMMLLLTSCVEVRKFSSIKEDHSSSFLEIHDVKGELLHETRIDFKSNRRNWIGIEELPPQFIEELITFEDQRFFSHPGVDVLAFLNAIRHYPKRGASTISMQLSSLINYQRGRKSFGAKIEQLIDALKLEWSWSKEEILEAYINLLTYKGDIQGLKAASLSLFNKLPMALDQNERLLLYSMIPSPNQKSDHLLERACRYAKRLRKKINCTEVKVALEESHIDSPLTERMASHAPHVAQKFKGKKGVVQTTLKKDLQLEASSLLKTHVDSLKDRNVTDGAVLIIDRSSGHILAYVGSSGHYSKASQVDHITSLRQAGSTLKPLLFYQSFAKRILTMNSPLKDEPFAVTKEGLTYQPENYQKGFTYKDVPAKVALGSSLNIPAVRVIDLVGPQNFYDLLAELEFRSLYAPEFYGHSMALGAVDITLWDLVRAYQAMAEEGRFQELSFISEKVKSKKISSFSPEVSFIISDILSEKENRYLTFGLQSSLSTDSWSAVKTGTSKDMRDNWCVGYTSQYVIGVWIGNSSGDPMWNVTGITGAAPIFNHMVNYLHKYIASTPPIRPTGLVEVDKNYYLPGTEPKQKTMLLTETQVHKILYPQQGAQFAYDPEIPERNQRIFFQGNAKAKWMLNGKSMTRSDLERGFLPVKKGKYKLELWEGSEKRDEISFYVKAGKAI